MTTVHMIRRFPAANFSDLISRLLYASMGLHTGFEKKIRLQNITFVVWLVIHVVGFLIVLKSWYNLVLEPGTKNLSLFTLFVSECIYLGAVVSFSIQIVRHHDEIELFIRRNGRQPKQVLLQLAYFTPFVVLGFRKGFSATDIETVLNEFYFFPVHYTVVVFFLACGDIVFNLKRAHNNLLASMANVEARHDHIRFLKWKLRDRVQQINRIFSWSWAIHYGLIFNIGVFAIIEAIDRNLSVYDKGVLLMADISFVHRLYKLAEASTSLKELCLKIESQLLSRRRGNEINRNIPEILIPTLTYREDWDILRSGCFPMESKRFFSFLVTSVTCTAVVLQFDYNVARNLQQTAAELVN